MPKDALRKQLQDLHGELAGAEKLDGELRELLRGVAREIEDLLEDNASDDDAPATDQVQRRVRRATVEFETDYPRLAGILQNLADTLAKLGI
jgi:hypothetical protein